MTNKIDPGFSYWLVKEKLKNSLASRFFLRFHASLILAGAVGTGWATSKLLFVVGIETMLWRHILSVLAAYVGFVGCLQLWIEYSGIREYLNAQRAGELTEGPVPNKERPASTSDLTPLDWLSFLDFGGCGYLILVIAAAFVVFYLLGGYLVVHATDFFADIVFELLLAAGLIKGIRKVDTLTTPTRVPEVTLWALALTMIAVVLFDLWARHAYPHAKTIHEVIEAFRRS